MTIDLKTKILATIFNLFQYNYEGTSDENLICDSVDRMGILSESIVEGSERNLCSTDPEVIEKMNEDERDRCWSRGLDRLVWIVYTTGRFESSYIERIHASKCLINECDPVFKEMPPTAEHPNGYKVFLYHKARSAWQLHNTSFVHDEDNEWHRIVGTSFDATSLAAEISGRVMTYFINRCGSEVGGIAVYATGRTCKWSEAYKRWLSSVAWEKRANDTNWVEEKLSEINKCKNKPYPPGRLDDPRKFMVNKFTPYYFTMR